jgi:hypothetical protein
MRVRSFFALAAVATMTAAGFASAVPSASAATTVQLTVADMYTFDAGSPFPKVICIDDLAITSGAPELHGPIAIAPGEHHLTVYGTSGPQVCNTEGNVNLDETITLSDAANQTLMVYWPSDSGPQASVFDDPSICAPEGEASVAYRPGAAVNGDANTDLGFGTDGVTPFVSDVEVGTQAIASVPEGSYGVWVAALTGTDVVVVNSGDTSPVVAGTIITAYTYGGNDGDRGMLLVSRSCSPDVPVIPLTPLTPAALPIAVTPLFTG